MAANANANVDVSGMLSAQGDFGTALTDVKTTYTQMDGQMADLRSSWTGDASTVFQTAMETWMTDFATVQQQLELMLEKLQANTGVYDTTHQDTSDAAQALHKGMSAGLPGF